MSWWSVCGLIKSYSHCRSYVVKLMWFYWSGQIWVWSYSHEHTNNLLTYTSTDYVHIVLTFNRYVPQLVFQPLSHNWELDSPTWILENALLWSPTQRWHEDPSYEPQWSWLVRLLWEITQRGVGNKMCYIGIWLRYSASYHQVEPKAQWHLQTAMPYLMAVVMICLFANGVFLFSLHCQTHLFFGMFTYNWIHCLLLFDSLNTSFIKLQPHTVLSSYHQKGNSLLLSFPY